LPSLLGRALLLLLPLQDSLLTALFERHNASRSHADIVLEGMARGGRLGRGTWRLGRREEVPA
jgi:hypothetical protein